MLVEKVLRIYHSNTHVNARNILTKQKCTRRYHIPEGSFIYAKWKCGYYLEILARSSQPCGSGGGPNLGTVEIMLPL